MTASQEIFVCVLFSVCCPAIVARPRCCHCKQLHELSECTKRGSGESYACLRCNSARVAIVALYKEKGQQHIWKKMSKGEKDAEIVSNRDKKPGRGKKFPVELSEKVPA